MKGGLTIRTYTNWWEDGFSSFTILPKVLFTEEKYSSLTADAKILYSLMLDRIKLSSANGWKDENGNIYEYFGISEIQRYLSCSKSTAISRKKELMSAGLIRSEKQLRLLPDRIYVLPIETDSIENRQCEYEDPTNEGSENELTEVAFLYPNNTKDNNKYINNIYLSPEGRERRAVIDIIKENIEYKILADRGYDMEFIDDLIDLMADAICNGRSDVRLGDRTISHNNIQSRFLKMNILDMQYVLDCISHNTTEVKNTRAYLLSTLYNAPLTRRTHYQLKAQHDMPQYCRA